MNCSPVCACDACAQARRQKILKAKASFYNDFYEKHPEARPSTESKLPSEKVRKEQAREDLAALEEMEVELQERMRVLREVLA